MSQKLDVKYTKLVEKTSQFNEGFIKIDNVDSDIEYFIEADVHYPEELHQPHNDISFLLEKTTF